VHGLTSRSAPLQWGTCQKDWLSYQTTGRSRLGEVLLRWDIPGHMSHQAIESAVMLVTSRHEVLRTTFDSDASGKPVQNVRKAVQPCIEKHHLGEEDDDRKLIRQLRSEGIDRTTGYPFRVILLRHPDGRRELMWLIAHIAADGTAAGIVHAEVRQVLLSLATGMKPSLRPVGPGPIDQALLERSPSGMAAARDSLEYWRRALAEMPTGTFALRPQGDGTELIDSQLDSPDLGRILNAAARRTGCTPNAVFTAALACVLRSFCQQERIPFFTVSSGRGRLELREMVGCLMRDLLVIIDAPAGLGFTAISRHAQSRILTAMTYDQFDTLEVLELEARAARDRGALMHSRIVLNFMTHLPGGVVIQRRSLTTPATRNPLDGAESVDTLAYLSATRARRGGLSVRMAVRQTAMRESDVRWLLGTLEAVLRHCALHGDIDGSELAHITAAPPSVAAEPGWVRVNHSWVNLSQIRAVIACHPAVTSAEVMLNGDCGAANGVTAKVESTDSTIRPRDLRNWILDRSSFLSSVVCPEYFEVRCRRPGAAGPDGAPLVIRGPGTRGLAVEPANNAERRLRDAVIAANELPQVSLGDSYCQARGRLRALPAVLSDLAGAGLTGLDVNDFRSTCTLSHLASLLTGHPDSLGSRRSA
jgi:hypothetical protein